MSDWLSNSMLGMFGQSCCILGMKTVWHLLYMQPV